MWDEGTVVMKRGLGIHSVAWLAADGKHRSCQLSFLLLVADLAVGGQCAFLAWSGSAKSKIFLHENMKE
jgi:hypothetical protein